MSELPWFQFYPNDWLAGTRGLSAVETGVYITIIATLYDRGEPLPNDPERLSRLCGASKRVFVAALARLLDDKKLIMTECGIWNARVAEELQSRNEKVDRNKKAADARWNGKTQQNQQQSDADALQPHCQNDAISEVRSQKSEEDVVSVGAREAPPTDVSRETHPEPDLAELELELRNAAGWQREPAPMLAVTGPIAELISGGCSLELDVLPTVRVLAPQCRSRTSWRYFLKAIAQARDDRLSVRNAASTPARRVSTHAKTSRAEQARLAANDVRDRLGIPRKPTGHQRPAEWGDGDGPAMQGPVVDAVAVADG